MSLNINRENEILAKISEFTVSKIQFVLTDSSSGGPRVGSGDSLEPTPYLRFFKYILKMKLFGLK